MGLAPPSSVPLSTAKIDSIRGPEFTTVLSGTDPEVNISPETGVGGGGGAKTQLFFKFGLFGARN